MDTKIISGIVAFAIIAAAIGLMIPGGEQPPAQTFPWQIEPAAGGATRVFGLTLGESTLQQAEQVFQAESVLSLFEPADKSRQRMIEAYFDKVTLGGLSAKVVVVVDFSAEQLQAMYDRGARISTLGDGSRKVSLHAEDIATVRGSPIASITYLPRIRLETKLLEKRFGQPTQIIKEKDSNTTHWLYPVIGLDVALDEQGNGVLQYVLPAKFDQLVSPLQ
ncbi:hypothetical protein [Kaarinaea lacus]